MGLRALPFSARTIPLLLSLRGHLSFKHVLQQVALYLPSPLSFSWSSSLTGFSCHSHGAAAAVIAVPGMAELCLCPGNSRCASLSPAPAAPFPAAGHDAPEAVTT